MTTDMSFSDEIIQISDDLGGDAVDWFRMETAMDSAGPEGLNALSDRVWRIAQPMLPAGIILAPDDATLNEMQSMLAAVFTMGVVYGREHVHRGYDLPRE